MLAGLPACTQAESTAPSGSVSSPADFTLPTVIPTGAPNGTATIPPPRKTDMTNRIVDMLKVIPDVAEARADLWLTDFASWRNALGVDVNLYRKMDRGEEKYLEYFIKPTTHLSLTNRWVGHPPFIAGMGLWGGTWPDSPIRTRNIGYGPLDVDRTVEAGIWRDWYEVIDGRFDIAIIKSISNRYADQYLNPVLSKYEGVDILWWSREKNDELVNKPPVFDYEGRGRTLAVQTNLVFGSIYEDLVYQMIDASLGNAASIADNPQFRKLAQQLEAMGAMSAEMSDRVTSRAMYLQLFGTLTPDQIDFFAHADLYAPLLERYEAYASGLGLDEKGFFVSLVLVYGSSEEATADVETLKKRLAFGVNSEDKPWSEDISASEVWADGTTLCAQLRGNVTSYWRRLAGETLLVRVD